MDDPEFDALMQRVRAGDQAAIAALLKTYEPEVRLMVRSRLPQALRQRFDSLDLAQSVWISLLIGEESGIQNEFASPRQFLGYVAGVTHNKILEKYRQHTRTKKYDLAREEPLDVRPGAPGARRDLEPAAPEPTPSQQVQAVEVMERLAAGRSPAEALVLELRSQGLTFEEIGQRTGLHERTARRLVESLRQRMEARRWEF